MTRAHALGLSLAALLLGCGDRTDAEADAGDETATGTDAATEATGAPTPDLPDAETETETDTDDTTEDTGPDEPGPVYPVPDWTTEPPEDHGFDPDALEQAAALAEAAGSGCLVITRHGVIVGEWYWDGWTDTTQTPVFSITKSITSAVVGIAEGEGLLAREDWASDYVDEWVGTAAEEVTIHNLLSNDSGRYWEFISDYVTLSAASDRTAFAVDLDQQHPPGDWWEYNNSAVQTLERVVSVATGEELGAYAQAKLFGSIGMLTTDYAHDGAGNALTYADARSTCRDLARFGYLYLRGGRWADEVQVIPQAWIDASLTASTELNDAYGYLWWLNDGGHWIRPSTPDRKEGNGLLIPEAPYGAFAARGLKAQLVAVEPTTDIVFTRLAEVPIQDLFGSTQIEGELWTAIMDAIVE